MSTLKTYIQDSLDVGSGVNTNLERFFPLTKTLNGSLNKKSLPSWVQEKAKEQAKLKRERKSLARVKSVV